MPLRYITCLVLGLLLATKLMGQVPTVSDARPLEAWITPTAIAFLGDRHILAGSLQAAYSPSSAKPRFGTAGPLYQLATEVAYAYRANQYWFVGGSLRHVGRPQQAGLFSPSAFLGHLGRLGPVFLYKSASIAWVWPQRAIATDYGQFRFTAVAFQEFELGKWPMRAELHGGLLRNFGDIRNENSRRIDLSSWKAHIVYRHRAQWWLGVFAHWQTQHLFVLGSSGRFSADGEQIEPPRPARNVNRYTPSIGLSLQYLINPGQRPILQWGNE